MALLVYEARRSIASRGRMAGGRGGGSVITEVAWDLAAVGQSFVERLTMGFWMGTNAEKSTGKERTHRQLGLQCWFSCLPRVHISSSVLPVPSSQHQSWLSQQLEIPLSECNCISASRPQSQWIIWPHRPWWIISDHMPWKTHIPHESQTLCHMHSGLSMEAPAVKRLSSKWKHGRLQKTSPFSLHTGSSGLTALVSSG